MLLFRVSAICMDGLVLFLLAKILATPVKVA